VSNPRILVLGAGEIGGYFGGRIVVSIDTGRSFKEP
jgi:hypothetical protein